MAQKRITRAPRVARTPATAAVAAAAAPTPAGPVLKKPPILFDATQKIIERVQARLGATFIAYWNSVRGSICHNDVVVLNQMLRKAKPNDKIMVFMKSDGGNGEASLRMVNVVRTYFKQVVALVPLNCESAATMFVLGADEIHMGPMAFLSAVDTSIRHDLSPIDKDNDRVSVGANELTRILAQWKQRSTVEDPNPYAELYKYIHPLVIGAVDRSDSLSVKLCEEILSFHMTERDAIKRIAHALNNDFPSHGYPILLREAQRLGLNACPLDRELESDLMELNEIYSEMGQLCRTDYDERHHHVNEVINITEIAGAMVYYVVDKDWHWRESDRTWVYTNEQSKWKMREVGEGGAIVDDELHIR
jgi:hypothetical protein